MMRHTLRVKTAPHGRVDTPLRAQSRVPVGARQRFAGECLREKKSFPFIVL